MNQITEEAILEATRIFVEAWNEGDIQKACQLYSDDAVFITSNGVVVGREVIIQKYLDSYPDLTALGELSLEMIQCWIPSEGSGQLASAVFKWEAITEDGQSSSGYTLENYKLISGELRLTHDASM